MRKLQLRPLSAGIYALVDDEDYERLSQFVWFRDRRTATLVYAYRTIARSDGRRASRRMHQDVFKVRKGLSVDHIDGNGLNNQKGNLRSANGQQQTHNSAGVGRGYKGVTHQGRRLSVNPWQARICINSHQRHLGYFATAEEAARAYDAAARRYFKKYARLNFPSDPWVLCKPFRPRKIGKPLTPRTLVNRQRDAKGRVI